MTPAVSVVITNYNYADYLEESIRSVREQVPGEYRIGEILVVDDGSTDRSAEILAGLEDVRVIRKDHEGFGPALTRGILEARSEWLALLDSDDCFEPEKLSFVAPFLAIPQVMYVRHAAYVVDADGQRLRRTPGPGGQTSTMLVRRSAALPLLPITNDMYFHVLDDLGLGIRTQRPLTRYRVHYESLTDRRTPGAWEDFLSGICVEIASRLDEMKAFAPEWATGEPEWSTGEVLDWVARHYRREAVRRTEVANRQRAAGVAHYL